MILPDNSSVHYLYDAAYLKSIERHRNGNLLYRYQNLVHDLSGELKIAQLIGHAGSLKYSHDCLGRVQEVNTAHWSQTIPSNGYDQAGRLVQCTIKDPLGSIDHAYVYDHLDHLQEECGQKNNIYSTDSIHNRISKNQTAYTVNALNQVTHQNGWKYSYDSNGNLIEKTRDNETFHYKYDTLDRLIKVESTSGTTSYEYDSFHRRLSKTSHGKTTRYLYQGQNEIGSIDELGNITELRVLTNSANEIGTSIALELNEKPIAPIHDKQGHLVCLIDSETGHPIEHYRYSAFGEEEIFDGDGKHMQQSNNPWRFASKRVDPETGWVFFGRRHYDPETGRWTTPDPIGFSDGPNLYAYLHHNPLLGIDPFGLRGEGYRDSCNVGANSPYFEGSSSFFCFDPEVDCC
jgi:RHS repeat-associated protein